MTKIIENDNIPLYKPSLDKQEEIAVLEVIRSGVLSRGNKIDQFEDEFATFVGKKFAIAVSSGTAALHLAVRAMGWRNGDEVITTPFSFIASANALLYERIKPILVDINNETLNINIEDIEKNISKKTVGILPVHIFGFPADKEIKNIAKKHNIAVLEDACEALGKPSKKFKVGQIGSISVYGFFPNKQITTGEGGMIVTDDEEIAETCRSMRDQGRSTKENWLQHVILGYNYRMTEMQAALGLVQLSKFERIAARKIKIAEKYNSEFKNIKNISIPYSSGLTDRSWFIYFIQLSSHDLREFLIIKLDENGIASHRYFPSIHLFPMYKEFGYKVGDFPVSERVSQTNLALPFFADMTDEQQSKVIKIIKESIRQYEN